MTDAKSAVRAVQNAALERALLMSTTADEYVVFAGALERARRSVSVSDSSVAGTLLLTCLVSLRLDDAERLHTVPVEPKNVEGGRDTLLTDGAMLAFDRFDLSLSQAASLANRSVEDFRAERRQRIITR